jgi:DNA polymerase-3 subunit alpha (Gram-positive type)
MKHLNAVVLDLETTGLHPKTDKIIEIGAVRIREGRIAETYSSLVDPGRILSPETEKLTGITNEMLAGHAPEFRELMPDLSDFIGEDVLLGHNILFDFSFLKRALLNELPRKSSFERMGIDTLRIARQALPPEQKKTLSALCSLYGIPLQAHRALNDALATFALYERLYQDFHEKEPDCFAPRPLQYQVKKESPVMQKQIRQIQALLSQGGIVCPYDLEKMSKNEASRYIDRLRTELSVQQSIELP